MALTTLAQDVYRDFATDGVPSSGLHEPNKVDIRKLLAGYEQIIDAFTSNGGLIYDTQALLYADLAHAANSMAWVIGDSTAAYNGVYKKVGASGSGSWTRVADLPYSFIVASDVGAGTPNAIQATSSLPISSSALVLLNVYEANTGSPVTVSFNGGTPLTIKSNAGNDVATGGLVAGMLLLGRVFGSTFRLASDQASAAVLAAAEAAQIGAEAAADRVEAAAASVVDRAYFATVSDLLADTSVVGYTGSGADFIVSAGNIIQAGGYRYQVAASGATDQHLETSGGVKLYAIPNMMGQIAYEQFGALGDGLFDNGDVFGLVATSLSAYSGTLVIGPGTFKTNKSLIVPANATLVGVDTTIIDSYGSAGTFTNFSVVTKTGEAPTLMPNIASNLSTGQKTITFAAAHGLSVGDVFLIYNDTDYSYSPWRPVYRQGEFVKVRSVTSTTVIEAERGIYSDGEWSGVTNSGVDDIGTGGTFSSVAYNSSTSKCYRCDGFGAGSVSGLRVIAPTTGTNSNIGAFYAQYVKYFSLNNFDGEGNSSSTISILNSFDCNITNVKAQNRSDPSGTNYAIVISNCQKLLASGLVLDSTRHTIALGGSNDFAIPCRDVHVGDAVLTSHVAGVANTDWHGNVEWCSYRNLSINGGGFNIAGNHNSISDVQIDTDGNIIYGREITGFDHTISGVLARTSYSSTANGLIDIGGNNATTFTANTALGGTLSISNINITAPAHPRFLVLIRNRGFAGAWNVKMTNIDYIAASAASGLSAIVRSDTVSGSSASRIDVQNVNSSSANVIPVSLAATDATNSKVSSIRQTGSVQGSLTTSVATLNVAVTFSKAFPKAPSIIVNSQNSTTNGTDRVDAIATSVSGTGFTLQFRRIDAVSNFAAAITATANWAAILDEV